MQKVSASLVITTGEERLANYKIFYKCIDWKKCCDHRCIHYIEITDICDYQKVEWGRDVCEGHSLNGETKVLNLDMFGLVNVGYWP